jgi:hypothetical protein
MSDIGYGRQKYLMSRPPIAVGTLFQTDTLPAFWKTSIFLKNDLKFFNNGIHNSANK